MVFPHRSLKKLRHLVLLWVLASLAALLMPLFDLAYLHPALARLMAVNTEQDAQRLAQLAIHRLLGDERDRLPPTERELTALLDQVRRDLGLLRLSLLSMDGALAQSAAQGYQQVAAQSHLQQVLATGRGMSRPVRSHHVSAGGAVEAVDLMLLTLPLRHNGMPLGALEIMYDWSIQRRQLDRLIGGATAAMIVLPAFFLLMVAFISRRAFQAVREQEQLQAELAAGKTQLEFKHRELTDLFRQIEVAKEEWQVSMDCIDEMMLLVDKDGLVRRCNESFRKLIGTPYTDILGKNWRQTVFSTKVEVVSLGTSSFQLYHKEQHLWLNLNFYPYQARERQGPEWTVITISISRGQDRQEAAEGPSCQLAGREAAKAPRTG